MIIKRIIKVQYYLNGKEYHSAKLSLVNRYEAWISYSSDVVKWQQG